MNGYAQQTAMITGASAGIGKAFADLLHEQGASVILVARRESLLQEMCERYNLARADSARYVALDLCDEGDLEELEGYMRANRIDILVNNAGRGSFGVFDELPLCEELQMIALNVVATTRLSHAVIPQMKARKTGAILVISSVAAFQPLPFMSSYAATKAFDFFHAVGLFAELRPHGVDVIAVCPGPTATEFGGVARVPGTATGMFRDHPRTVAEQSLSALRKRKPYVVTGVRSKLLVVLTWFVPVRISTWILSRQLGPLTRYGSHKHSGLS